MRPHGGRDRPGGIKTATRLVLVCVVIALATSAALGQSGGDGRSVSIRQGEACTSISPLTGGEPVKAFYDYRTQSADNPYTNEVGSSYSSQGTTHLQTLETSLLFLYTDANGTMSLVFVHGTFNGTDGVEGGDDGGSASFNLTGLPAAGSWAVKDDEYDGEDNFDRWRHEPTRAEIDWTWGESATDGGAYAGLGDEFEITIGPAFNEDATLHGQYYEGTIREWVAISATNGETDRTTLDMTEPVMISSEECDGSDDGTTISDEEDDSETDESDDAGDTDDDEPTDGGEDDDEGDGGSNDEDDANGGDDGEAEDNGVGDDDDGEAGEDGEDEDPVEDDPADDTEGADDGDGDEGDGSDADRVVVCHTTGSETDSTVTIEISETALQAHLGHGDTAGSCD